MRYLSQTQAAKLAGCARRTIANRIDAGVLSVTPDGIDPSELVRVFPAITGDALEHFAATGDVLVEPTPDTAHATRTGSPATSTGDTAVIAAHATWLQGLVDEQRATIARKDAELRDALADAEERAARREAALSRQIDQLTALLPAPSDPKPPGFWRRLFG